MANEEQQGEPLEQALARNIRPIVLHYFHVLNGIPRDGQADAAKVNRITDSAATVLANWLEGKHPPTTCTYCGTETLEPDPAQHRAAILAHIATCDKRPEHLLLMVCEGYRNGLRKWLDLFDGSTFAVGESLAQWHQLADETREILDGTKAEPEDLTDAQERELAAQFVPSEADLIRDMADCQVPDNLRDGLVRYLRQRIRPGNFLYAVLSNDFVEAAARASGIGFMGYHGLAAFLVNHVPAAAWGSKAKVDRWLAAGRPGQ